jgi:hypothetical protein
MEMTRGFSGRDKTKQGTKFEANATPTRMTTTTKEEEKKSV